ncbi:hypothetical protein QTO34_019202 [Cnephaeus nilssonii]|uniref:L1 transposable element RRM domain-containing protein n=1 Tax=Cnephaeus nilssonii TaxID=3371016 RepID=A0AA40HAT7_CNENI|nr:hypothetical protein QTO34_019202 [Eptesicus nilssonii]
MGRQKGNSQRKAKEESPERELNELEASSLTEKEFRVFVIRMFKRMDDKYTQLNENYKELNENVTNMKRNQEAMKNDIAAIKNTMEGLKSRVEEAEDHISELEDKVGKNTQTQQQLERRLKKQEESLRELWDNTKRNNIRIIGIKEGEEEKQEIQNMLEEIMTGNFPDIGKKKTIQVQEVHRVPNKLNPKRPTPRHIIIKLTNTNDKARILKAARERQKVTYKGSPIRISTDFSTETHQARREWNEIYKVMQNKGLNPRILYPARLSFKIEGGIRSFTDKKGLREFITTKPAMQEMLKGLLSKEQSTGKAKRKRIQKVEDSVRSLGDNFKRTKIRIMGVPEEEREQDTENLFEEIMTENFPHLVKEIDLQVQEAHRTPNKRNPKRTTPRHIIIKMPRAKDKERILKAAREKQLVTYNGAPI